MILAIDVHYSGNSAFVAGVIFDNWGDSKASAELLSRLDHVAAYEPGSFYKRELPCIHQLLNEHELKPTTIVIDGYVYLDGAKQPGLGKKLQESLAATIEIIGVAKNPFTGIGSEYALHRGGSKKPLYITSTANVVVAKQHIAAMSGDYRIPTLLKRADQICRQAAAAQCEKQ